METVIYNTVVFSLTLFKIYLCLVIGDKSLSLVATKLSFTKGDIITPSSTVRYYTEKSISRRPSPGMNLRRAFKDLSDIYSSRFCIVDGLRIRKSKPEEYQ